MSRRAALAVAFAVASAAPAVAGGNTRKVEVQTDPPGAKVFLGDVDSSAVCDATPCTIDAPVGTTPIIIKLDGYDPVIDVLDVPDKRARKPIVKSFTLSGQLGTIVVDAQAAAGADVTVDDEDKGKAPVRVQATATSHHVVVARDGQTLFDGQVQVTANQEAKVTPQAQARVAQADPPPDPGGAGSGDVGEVHASTPAPPRGTFVALAAQVDVGFRTLQFAGQPKPADEESGQVLIGPSVELWPARALRLQHLRGLSLFGRVGFGANHQQVTNMVNGQPVGSTTSWSALEALLRYRWTIAERFGIQVGAGYAQQKMELVPMQPSFPAAAYSAIELGARASVVLGAVEPYLEYQNRIVLSGGDLQTQFQNASATGLRVAGGLGLEAGRFLARVEGSLMLYSWSYTPTVMNPISGATDQVETITAVVGLRL